MNRKSTVIVICILAAFAVWHFSVLRINDPMFTVQSPATAPTQTITIGWGGDMVPATDVGYNITVLNNVTESLESPDLMIGNLEGTFAHSNRSSKCLYINSMCHAFAGDPSFADALKAAGFDFISLVNNHALDYGTPGLKDTEAELERVGLPYIAPDKPTASITIKGTKIGIVGLSSTQPQSSITNYAYIAQTVQALKKDNDIVVVIFHGGAEGSDKTTVTGGEEYEGSEDRGNVQAVAYTAINAGADLVLGDGPHVLRKVEWYHDKPIAYSLGNFVGGDGKLSTRGNLGLGGIFTATFSDSSADLEHSSQSASGRFAPVATDFTSVLLAKDGTPSPDPADQAKQLLNSLSK
ncbi:MAG TPA: CapA family protein [Candidatus Paceibacterota bacterium]|jgi:poly-gamma-glutamate capsule biosynthesis protein CapA/YwtB (metallophosphatase superfamily)|nr:CapA family protein [Candidatus Paceibacterota bacterium]